MKATPDNVKRALEVTRSIVDRFPLRLTGSPDARGAADAIAEELRGFCHRVERENFTHRPDGFLRFIKVVVPLYIAAMLLLYMRPALVGISFALLCLCVAMFAAQFVFYLGWFDFLAPKKRGENVYGVIEPAGEVKQQVIIAGHYDSPYVFTWIEKFRSALYAPVIITGIATVLGAFILTGIWSVMVYAGSLNPSFAAWLPLGGLISIAPVLPLSVFTTGKVSPGAGDNMIACAIAAEAGRIIAAAHKKDQGLKNTRLIVMAFDAEEAGLKGAQAFCRKHEKDLHDLKTYLFNIDGIYECENLKFFTRDINSVVPLSKELTAQAQKAAAVEGYDFPAMAMPFGGGATDAAEFARIGVEAVTLVGLNTETFRMDLAYHTERDLPETIEPEAVEACLKTALRFTRECDA